MKALQRASAKLLRQLLFTTAISLVAVGCASVMKGELQSVSFKSDPSDAKLLVYNLRDGGEIINATTPYTATLKRGAGYFRKARYKVVIERPGYNTEEILLEGAPNGWYVGGNLIFGGLIGYLIVDPATGSMWTLDPEELNVKLTRQEALLPDAEGLRVVLKGDLPDSLHAKMRPVTGN